MSVEEAETNEEFERKVEKQSEEKPVLVDFWAEWCLPCKRLGPNIEEAKEVLGGDVDIVKANIDELPEKADEFEVRNIPNVKLIIEGEIEDSFAGVMDPEDIVEWVRERI